MKDRRGALVRVGAAAVALALVIGPASAGGQEQGSDSPAVKRGADSAAEPAAAPQIEARAWILVDPRDEAILTSSASGRQLAIASATKLMTAYLALQKLKPKQRLTAPPYNALPAESLIDLRAGEKMTVSDLLYGLVLESGNDAAVTLAEGVAGTVPRFVAQMNRQAATLGLTNTSFANPIGLDAAGNHSSAADLAELASRLLENPLFARIADSQSAVLRSGDHPRRFDSRNTLLGRDPSVDGVKTGHTIQAGWVLVGSATRAGTQLVSVVLGARSEAARDAETLKLLDYGFSLYMPTRAVEAGEELADPKLDYRDERLSLVAERKVVVSARKGQPVDTIVEAPEEVSGEIAEGTELGRVMVTVEGREAISSPLVASESVAAATTADKVMATAQNPIILIPAGAFVIVVGLFLAARGRSSEESEPESLTEAPRAKRRQGNRTAKGERTPEERRKMQEERMRRRRERAGEERGGQ
jgi:D-alanyl-D-alanine carboxypeptidase (penicillin-binding protein 5/6)